MLGILLALILIEIADDLADELSSRITLELLRDGDDLHAYLPQLADIELALKPVAEEAGHLTRIMQRI